MIEQWLEDHVGLLANTYISLMQVRGMEGWREGGMQVWMEGGMERGKEGETDNVAILKGLNTPDVTRSNIIKMICFSL